MTPSFWTEQLKRWPFAEMRKTMGKEGLQKGELGSSVLYTLSMRCYYSKDVKRELDIQIWSSGKRSSKVRSI